MSTLLGKEHLHIKVVEDAGREVINKGNCEVVVVSMGAAGAILVTKEMALQIMPPVVKRKSTVGAGDSMVAGLTLTLSRNKSLTEAVQYGVACGTAATMNPETELCKADDVEKLYQQMQSYKYADHK